jgi:hypothetical protein
MLYLGAGLQCYDLRPNQKDPLNDGAARLLAADSERPGGVDCTDKNNYLASHTTSAWEAGATAVSLMTGAAQPNPPATQAEASRFLASLQVHWLQLAEGILGVTGGQRSSDPLIPPLVQCVTDVRGTDPQTRKRRSYGPECLASFQGMDQ